MDLVAKTAEADLLLMAKSDKAGNSGDKKRLGVAHTQPFCYRRIV